MKKILFCRHGESYHNVTIYSDENPKLEKMPRPILFNEEDTMLTIIGENQAQKLGEWLSTTLPPQVSIVSSPWYRATRTKTVVKNILEGKNIGVEDKGENKLPTDVDLGGLDPKYVRGNKEMEEKFYDYWSRRAIDRATERPLENQGESIQDVRTRVKQWYKSNYAMESGDNEVLIVVTHAGFIYALIAELLDLNTEQLNKLMDNLDLPNAQAMEVNIENNEMKLSPEWLSKVQESLDLGTENFIDPTGL